MNESSSDARVLLEHLLRPRSIALIGASDDPVKLTGRPIEYLKRFGYQGRILPINPNRETVQGIPAYSSIGAIEGPVDLALLGVSAERTADALRECVAKGVPVAIAYASGFAETGERGAALQAELAEICRESGIRLLGPNCLGLVAARDAVTVTFSSSLDEGDTLPSGPIGFVSQSGAFGTSITSRLRDGGVGVGYYVNTGNEADLDAAELLSVLTAADDVSVLLCYLEGVRDGRRFVDMARAAFAADKPVVAVKVGSSAAGARAVSSHTGSMAGEDAVFDAVARQFGILRVPGVEAMLDTAQLLATGRRMAGPNLTVLSISGGAGVLTTDAAESAGLAVAAWDAHWQARMAQVIPPFGSPVNPIDLTASLISKPDMLARALDVAVEHPGTDALVVVLTNVERGSDAVVSALRDAASRTDKPLVVVWIGGSGRPARALADAGVPTYRDPHRAVAALSALAEYGARPPLPGAPEFDDVDTAAALDVIAKARASGRIRLDELEATKVLAAYGIPMAPAYAAATPDEAALIAQRLMFPVAVKVLSADIGHKSDLDAVKLGLPNSESVASAAHEVLAAAAGASDARVLVQQMARPGQELALGVTNDPVFGPTVLVGSGGVLIELLDDRALALAPLDPATADALIGGLRGARLLDGYRGGARRDRGALAEAMSRLSLLAADLADDIAEIDINPIFVHSEGAGVTGVDALITLTEKGGGHR
ncbi:acetate--CoA ligase family protein [Nocardia sp. NPDC052112]|uniref:acetate--CoA ligase family protein n=1 Tax=Nocardia sp. NPDC052112 TaxID=3155646 RepID=UPI00343C0B63